MTQGNTATSFDALKVNQGFIQQICQRLKNGEIPGKKVLGVLLALIHLKQKLVTMDKKSIKARFEFGKSLATPHQPIEAVSPLH